MRLRSVLETVLYVEDLEAAADFYREVLGLEQVTLRPGQFAFFRLEHQMLLLFVAAAACQSTKVPPHGATGTGHVCFAVADEALEAWARRLTAAGVGIEQWQDWPGGGRSFYFRDPAGNSLELASPRIWGFSQDLSTRNQAG